MPDLRAQYTEEAVGAGHPTKADVINRLALAEHGNDGTHKSIAAWSSPSRSAGTVYQNTSGKDLLVEISVWGATAGELDADLKSDAANPPTGNVGMLMTRSNASAGNAHIGMMVHIVPNNHYYKLTITTGSLNFWRETNK